MSLNYQRTKYACYSSYFTMTSAFCLPPLLFVTLREMYGISYTLLGTLVLVNFCTQLTVDLIFTFLSKHFNIKQTVKIMPLITTAGLIIYALIPTFFPKIAFAGLFLGTMIFSVAAGLSEVLISPIVAAIPSKNPQREMSLLHSFYAFGVVSVVLFSSVFLRVFGHDKWMYLTIFFALLPIVTTVMFTISPFPDMDGTENASVADKSKQKYTGLLICVMCIFFGSCAENVMSNWLSSFLEKALNIEKSLGDILGVAVFAVLLGLGRIAYSRFGKNIGRVLLFGMVGAAVSYITAGLSSGIVPAFIACAFTGLFTSMLWPGTLILMEENIPGAGVAAFALMAAGGDLGASVAPQLMGIVIDKVSVSNFALQMGEKLSLSAEQIGLKAGMIVTALFPILGTAAVITAIRYFKKAR